MKIRLSILFLIGTMGASHPAIGQNAASVTSPESKSAQYGQLMKQAATFAKEYAGMKEGDAKRDAVRRSISETLTQAFELRQRIQRREIEATRAELDRLEKKINERDSFKESIVRRKVEELMTGKDLTWPSVSPSSTTKPAAVRKIQPGDVVALYIEGVLPFNAPNQPPTPPPITKLDSGAVVSGYPLPITEDGTVQLPLLEPVKVAGMTVREAEKAIRQAYVSNDILRPEKARPMMTLVPKSDPIDSILTLPQRDSAGR